MNLKELAIYYKEQVQLQKDIQSLWEVGKKSKAKEKRLNEVNLIIQGIDNEFTLENARKHIIAYHEVLESYPVLKEKVKLLIESK
jgi:predicted transcriptional regulator YdeE